MHRILSGLILAAGLALAALTAAHAAPLAFTVDEGLNHNAFYRDGPIAAHILLRSGTEPRLLVAFPAGNSGVGLWFERTQKPVRWSAIGAATPLRRMDARGRPLFGVAIDAAIEAPRLGVSQAVLSNVRVLRDYQALGARGLPDAVRADAQVVGRTLRWARDRLDGAPGYELSVTVTGGAVRDGALLAGQDGAIRLHIEALTGEPPLTPLADAELLSGDAGQDKLARNALTFLSYKEKFLAGSWRFNTYFGRDTLMSVRLLMPALQPQAVEAGLGSVLARLSPDGIVAHEEDIGEFAILGHRRLGASQDTDAPIFNFNMVDGDYMLAPVAAAWLLDDPRGRARAKAFLQGADGRFEDRGRTAGRDLVVNFRRVVTSATPFGEKPSYDRLIALKEGHMAGQWRDSDEGIGRGRYAYDVNAVFVPAALDAIARFFRSGLLDAFLTEDDRALFGRADALAETWRKRAPPLFDVSLSNASARASISAYAAAAGVPSAPALQAIGTGGVAFKAISLDGRGRPVAIVHTDEAFDLLFGAPDPDRLDSAVRAMMQPFPAGLFTDAGVLVANPAFAPPEVQARFSKNAYHGAVVWSWQQAVLAEGLRRQLARTDLPAPTRARLSEAQSRLWRVIRATAAVRTSELWSWTYAKSGYRVAPFGASGADADESNAAQLWSTVYLAVRPPAVRR